MLASRYLVAGESTSFAFRWFDALFSKAERGYRSRSSGAWHGRHDAADVRGHSGQAAQGLYSIVARASSPASISGKIDGNTRVAEGTPFEEFVERHNRIVKIVQANPNVASALSVVGADGTLGNAAPIPPHADRP